VSRGIPFGDTDTEQVGEPPPLQSRLLRLFLSFADGHNNHGENKQTFNLLGFTSWKKKKKHTKKQPKPKIQPNPNKKPTLR